MPSQPPEGDPAPLDGALPASALTGVGERGFSVYLHVPFCATRCGYCDFNTYTAAELGSAPGASQRAYLDAVVAELDLVTRVLGTAPQVDTIFFGGGTPTLLAATDLVGLLQAVRERFEFAPGIEVTTEANPESVDQRYLQTLREGGFTRLSVGMQSAVPHVLATLERRHSPGRAQQVLRWARAAGFESVSLDLIYGTPGETAEQWRHSLEAALSAEPDHASAYSLIVEPGTRLAGRVRRGELPDIDDDVHAEFHTIADETFHQAGLDWYEVSNWARPGQECRHNLAYWRGHDWWGVGPGAHSHVGGIRWWNHRHPVRYVDTLSARQSPALGRETLTSQQRQLERILLELRLASGLALDVLEPEGVRRAREFAREGLAEIDCERIRLTASGRLLADGIAAELAP